VLWPGLARLLLFMTTSLLDEDIERYKAHPDCQALVCFVYDPAGLIPNPHGTEADLKRDENPFPVRVLIRPQGSLT
jgi:hypothetical protein